MPGDLPGWKGTLAALLLVSVAGYTPLVASLNAVLYDYGSAYLPASGTAAAKQVLLVEADYDRRNDHTSDLESLTHTALENGAAQVVFLFSPSFTPTFASWARTNQKVVLGLPALPDAAVPEGFRPNAIQTTGKPPLPTGLVWIDSGNHGLFIWQKTTHVANGRALPSIEYLAARQRGRQPEPGKTYWVNFAGGLASLPRLTLEQALHGNIVTELVKGRSLVIGLHGGNQQSGLNIPGGTSGEVASPNEFHAFALNTLLTGRAILPLSSWPKHVVLALFTLLLFLLHQPVPQRYTVNLTLVLGGLYGMAAWVALAYFSVWLPLVEMLALHVGTLILVYRGKGQAASLRLERMLTETSARLSDHLLPASFVDSEEHWSYYITMVEQMLSLNRFIFLERIAGDHRAREIKALHCDISDIDERRRDYERTPYTTALQRQAPIEVDNYLKPIADINERQFLAPLVFGGEVLGFWAFGIRTEKLLQARAFLPRASLLSEEIGRLLYQRKVLLERESGQKSQLGRYLADHQSTAFSTLRNTIALLEKRTATVENTFRDLTTAAILYDFFGRVIMVNIQMNSLLQSAGLSPYKLTAVDLVTSLTGKERDTVRNYIQFTVFEGQHMSLQTSVGADKNRRDCLLSLRAIGGEATAPAGDEPFHSSGLLVELVDISEINRMQAVKNHLAERLNHSFKQDISALMAASTQLKNPGVDAPQRTQILATMDSKIESAAATITKTLEFLADDDSIQAGDRYPVDVLKILIESVANSRKAAARRGIAIEAILPPSASFVLAAQNEIKRAFENILAYLIDDCIEEGSIRLSLTETGQRLHIALENTGMGIPQAQMDAFLFGQEEVSSKAFQGLRDSVSHIKGWGGQITVASRIGECVRFELTLEVFL